MGCAALALGVSTGAMAQQGEFDGSAFTCLQYTNGQGENSSGKAQAGLAKIWVTGYLAGYYKAKGNLEIVDDKEAEGKLNSSILSKCREYPQTSILTVSMQALGSDARKLPAMVTADFNPQSYTCGNHVDAKNGSAADGMKADLAELWAFAFIQGFKNVAQPDMVIPMENKKVLTGAISNNCAKNRDTPYFDLTALVADKVKLQ
jgi:hypothetical protein